MTQDSYVREEHIPEPVLGEPGTANLPSVDHQARCVVNVHVKLPSVLALVHSIHMTLYANL